MLARADEPQYAGGEDPFTGHETVGIEVRGLDFGIGAILVLASLIGLILKLRTRGTPNALSFSNTLTPLPPNSLHLHSFNLLQPRSPKIYPYRCAPPRTHPLTSPPPLLVHYCRPSCLPTANNTITQVLFPEPYFNFGRQARESSLTSAPNTAISQSDISINTQALLILALGNCFVTPFSPRPERLPHPNTDSLD